MSKMESGATDQRLQKIAEHYGQKGMRFKLIEAVSLYASEVARFVADRPCDGMPLIESAANALAWIKALYGDHERDTRSQPRILSVMPSLLLATSLIQDVIEVIHEGDDIDMRTAVLEVVHAHELAATIEVSMLHIEAWPLCQVITEIRIEKIIERILYEKDVRCSFSEMREDEE